jgi:hypothetical protein
MVPLFTTPWAFAGLVAIPTLAAIYWLRHRFRRHPVSSLMLWMHQRDVREGGTRRDRLRTPLLFYLELLAILLLVLAAAEPHLQTAPGTRPLVVVLDDSYSMRAGGMDSPRNRAVAALEEELRDHAYYSVRFLLAGETPQVLDEPVHSAGEAVVVLQGWKCRAPAARLEETMALAAELGGERGLSLVVTDHAPESPPEKGRLRWWSFGTGRPNIAFVNAARTERDGRDRCLLEIANLATEAGRTTLVVETGEPGLELQRSPLTLDPGETRRVTVELKEGTAAVRARLDPQPLELDHQAILQPSKRAPVRVDVQVSDQTLRELTKKAITVARDTLLTAVHPDLVISDEESVRDLPTDAWTLQFLVEKEAEAFSGPFVVDRTHPLTAGLSLQGVIWGAGKTGDVPGFPVITAGNMPLLTDQEDANEGHELRLRLRLDHSTLQDSPSWPILLWNLVQWRASSAPGLSRANLRLGEETVLTLPSIHENVQVTDPMGETRTLPVQGRQVTIRAADVGVYTVQADDHRYQFAVNTLNREESDLQGCASGRWGDWLDETSLRLEYQNMAWVLLLLVLATLTVHGILVARGPGRS